MPDLDHLRIDGTTYDLKDNTAREKDAVQDNELGQLKSAVDEMTPVVETDETGSDLDIADTDGNVLVRFQGGHIKTKEFDSKKPLITEPTNSNAKLDIADIQGHVIARFENGHIKTKEFDSSVVSEDIEELKIGFEYKIDDGYLMLGFGYTDEYDAVVVMNAGRNNGLFDFHSFRLKEKGTSLKNLGLSNLTVVWNSGTDMHGPFEFNAVNDPDGYYANNNDPSFTGGNHTVTINDVVIQTATSKYVKYYADGTPITSGYGRCSNFEIRWANDVMAYNCVKTDGTSRYSLREAHRMVFDGVKFFDEVTLIPLEEIKFWLWYGFQSVSWGTTYNKITFVDGSSHETFSHSSSEVYSSGNRITSGMIQIGDEHCLEMTVDTNWDLGKRTYYDSETPKGAFTSTSKCYFNIIGRDNVFESGNQYHLRGTYRFYPNIAISQ